MAAASIAALAAVPAHAASSAADKFGAREAVTAMSLSPDGKSIAYLSPLKGAGTALLVVSLTPGATPKVILTSSGEPDRLEQCGWSTNARLVCQVYMIADGGLGYAGYTRMVALNADGSDVKELSRTNSRAYFAAQDGGDIIDWTGDGDGTVLMTRQNNPESSTGTLITNSREGLGVDLVDTNTLRHTSVEAPHRDAIGYIADGLGTVRIMAVQPIDNRGYYRGRQDFMYRTPGSHHWQPLSSATITPTGDKGFEPVAVDRVKDVAYGFDDHEGHQALYSVALDGSLNRTLLVSRPDADVDGVLTIGRQQRVVGATYSTDKNHAIFFDPALQSLQAALEKALPGNPQIAFMDASADESKLLLFASSDTNPGQYYLFDKSSHKLSPLLAARPELDGIKLAPQQPVSYKAADGTVVPAYLTLPPGSDGKNLPAIVMPHGGPASRDYWGFDWLVQYFANRGFAVLQPEYRGSAGYGDGWFQKNGFQSWRTAIGDVNDAGRFLLSSGIAAPGKLAVAGWSYGGYAALQSQVLDPDLFKAVVAVAPVTDLNMLRQEATDKMNGEVVSQFIGTGPEVRAGSPLQHTDRFKAPVLIFHGDRDRNVGVNESREMVEHLKAAGRQADYVEFHNLDHQLVDGSARAEMLAKADAFLSKSLGLQ
ncbi:MAG: alpha/beta hydrolase family protein [Sphingomonas sp.]